MRALRRLEVPLYLALYLAFAAFLFGVADVPPAYRAVFIDRTVADFLPPGDIGYAPGATIRAGELDRRFTGTWWNPEDGGRWGKGPRNTLRLRLVEDLAAGGRIAGQLTAAQPRGRNAIDVERVAIEVNGIRVGEVALAAPTDIAAFEFPIPAPLAAGTEVEIAFVPTLRPRPILLGLSGRIDRSFFLLEVALLPPP